MTLDLKGKRVVVTGGKHPVERAIAEAVAQEGADVVIWPRKRADDGNEAKVLPTAQLEIPSQAAQRSFFSYVPVAQVNGKTQILLVTSIPGCRFLRF